MAINIIERAVTPYNSSASKVSNKEQYSLYAPAANVNKPGMAGYDPRYFAVREQIVELSAAFRASILHRRTAIGVAPDSIKESNTVYSDFTHKVLDYRTPVGGEVKITVTGNLLVLRDSSTVITEILFAAGRIWSRKLNINGLNVTSIGQFEPVYDKYVTNNELAVNAVRTENIYDANVTRQKIAAKAVDTTKLEDSSVTTIKIAAKAITTDRLNDAAVTTDKIADGAVITDKITNGAVTTEKLGTGSVTGDKMAMNSVSSSAIKKGTVTYDKLSDDVKNKISENASIAKGANAGLGFETVAKMEAYIASKKKESYNGMISAGSYIILSCDFELAELKKSAEGETGWYPANFAQIEIGGKVVRNDYENIYNEGANRDIYVKSNRYYLVQKVLEDCKASDISFNIWAFQGYNIVVFTKNKHLSVIDTAEPTVDDILAYDIPYATSMYIEDVNVPDYWWNGAKALELETKNVDIADVVRSSPQTLTDEQKAQARENIGVENVDIADVVRSSPQTLTDEQKAQVRENIGVENLTVKRVTESTEDGGDNVITFSDGVSFTVKNGRGGKNGKSAYQQAVDGGYTGSEVEFEQKMAREIPVVTQTTGNSTNLVMSQGAVTELFDSINELPYGGSKEWLEKNGDRTKLYQVDGYVWGYIESDGWTKSGTQFILVSSWADVVNAGGTPYAYRTPGSNECTVLEYHEASGDVGVPVYSEKPTTAKEGDIIAVGGRKYKASITSKQEPDYTNLANPNDSYWKEGYRISGSASGTGYVTQESGCVVTNMINVSAGDVVRITGIDLTNNKAKICICQGANNPQPDGAGVGTKITAFTEATVTSSTTNSVVFTAKKGGYWRFSGILNGASKDIIITVNEEIKDKTVTTVTWNDIGEYVPPVAAGWSETAETYPVIDSLSATANSGASAVYSADGYLYTYIAGSDWMATSKYTQRPLDNSLSETSSNAVQNKVVTAAINAVTHTANKNANEILSLRNDVEALGTPSSDVVTIPSYWESMVANKTATVKALQEAGGKSCVSFAYASDTHIPDNDNGRTNDIGKVMAKMLDNCEIPFAVITGDVATRASYSTEAEYITMQSQMKEHLAPLWGTDRLLIALGNHDGCYGDSSGYYRKQFSPERMWQTYFRSHALDFRKVFSEDGLYYYVDNIPQKTRFIILNSNYAGEYAVHENGFAVNNRFSTSCYGQAQLDWLSSVALDMPEGYGALIFTHVPFNVTYTVDKAQLIGIIDAFNNKTSFMGTSTTSGWTSSSVNVNFSDAKGEIIAVVAGHVHGDSIDTDTASCPVITILSAGASANEPYNESAPVRKKGTDSETSFDIVTVNRKTRTIYCTRVGAGSDRTINY